MIVDLTFHEEWHGFRVRCQPSCSGSFAWPGSHPSLAIDKDATVEVVLATRATSVLPACVCYLAHLGPHLYSKRKNQNFGTAARVLYSSAKKVKLRSCR